MLREMGDLRPVWVDPDREIQHPPELLELVHGLIRDVARDGIIRKDSQVLSFDPTADDIASFIGNVVWSEDVSLPCQVAKLVNFIVSNPRMNPLMLNPYNPNAPYLKSFFQTYYGDSEKALALALWGFEQREDLRTAFERASRQTFEVGLMGQLGAGKTTFLRIEQNGSVSLPRARPLSFLTTN